MTTFQADYLEVRRREGRLLSANQVAELAQRHTPTELPVAQHSEWRQRRHRLDLVISRLHRLRPRKIADIGAGCGLMTLTLERHGHRAIALDPVIAELRVGRQAGLCCVAGSLEALPLGEGCFDCVLAASCLQYLADLQQAVAALRRLRNRVLRRLGAARSPFPILEFSA